MTSRVRVAIDAGNLARDRRGLGRVTRGILAAAIADGGFHLTLLVDKRGDARELAREFPTLARAACKTARRSNVYDLVWFPFNGVRYRTAAPSIVTIADAFAFTQAHTERIARMREQGPIRRAARDAAIVVTISQWSRDELVRELAIPERNIRVVALAPDNFWSPGQREALPPAIASSRFALLVGALEPRKNARLALDAFARAQRDESDLLLIVGDLSPADTAYAKSIGVRAGRIAPNDTLLRALYRSAVVVLVPSFAEGFGLVAVEALACGAPVIASNTSALPEATVGAALLLDPRDAAAWARAIRSFYDDPTLAALWRARATDAFARCDRGAPARKMLELFHEAALH